MGAEYSTHVANAYASSEFVWIALHSDSVVVDSYSTSINIGGCVQATMTFKDKTTVGMVRVNRGSFHKFTKQQGDRSKEFMTILSADGKTTIGSTKIADDRSYIITRRGEIRLQKYGAGLWIDEVTGEDHYPF